MNLRDGGGAVVWHDARAVVENASVGTPLPVVPTGHGLQPARIADALFQAAQRYNLHPALLEALVWQESRWRVNAVSPKGAVGFTQLMPATARQLGVDPHDPLANLDGGARYLRMMLDRFGGNLSLSLAAYNAGPRRVEQAGGIPRIRETQGYVAAILNRLGSANIRP